MGQSLKELLYPDFYQHFEKPYFIRILSESDENLDEIRIKLISFTAHYTEHIARYVVCFVLICKFCKFNSVFCKYAIKSTLNATSDPVLERILNGLEAQV